MPQPHAATQVSRKEQLGPLQALASPQALRDRLTSLSSALHPAPCYHSETHNDPRVVGSAVETSLATALPLTALQRALAWRQPAPGLLLHSDRGGQHASHAHRAVLTAHAVVQSLSRRSDCRDNAVAESFFATLEHELLATADFYSHHEAEHAIAAFIDDSYNPERRHSTLGCVSPMQYERHLRAADKAA